MKLKLSFSKGTFHKEIVTCVGWNNTEEIYSCSDDHILMKSNLVTNETQKVCELPDDIFPVDFDSLSKSYSGKKQLQDLFLVTSSDGKFHLISRNGRIEKSVEAHKGATLVGQWSPDGSSLLTAGEDGFVKIWSRNGMLRSTVYQGNATVYAACWGSDSTQVLYAVEKNLTVKPLAPNTKSNRWKAHDGIILAVAWDYVNDLIVSGGEDCRYKVWDNFGRQIFTSSLHDYPIMSLAWAPNGNFFAVGSYNTLRLCDKIGWSHTLEKPSTGSLYKISWSSDGTQLAAACANNQILIAHVIERKVEWGQYEAVTLTRKTLTVHDVLSSTSDKLEFPERVIHLALAYKHLVAITPTQCYMYNLSNLNTPIVVDLREGSVSHLLLSERNLLLMEKSTLSIYNYDGRLISTMKWPTLNTAYLNPRHISLAPDSVVIRDQADDRGIQLMDINGKELGTPVIHNFAVMEIELSQFGTIQDRLLAFVDKNRDLFIATVVSRINQSRKIEKLGGIVQSFKWNSNLNILSAMQDTALTIWYYPLVLFVDNSLTRKITSIKDSSEFGRSPCIVNFVENHVGVRKADGALVSVPIVPYVSVLQGYVTTNKWNQALRICRMVKENILWACLAAMSTNAKKIDVAELAYAAINMYDKVVYIQHIKSMPVRTVQIAEMFLLGGNVQEAENMLLQNGLIFRAIWSNIATHNWNRALEIAVRHKTHIDTVLLYRKRYLEGFEKAETNDKFLQIIKEIPLNEEQIDKKVSLELEKEKK